MVNKLSIFEALAINIIRSVKGLDPIPIGISAGRYEIDIAKNIVKEKLSDSNSYPELDRYLV